MQRNQPAGQPMSEDPLIGRQMDEYRVEALLGQGGMARVYRGRDTRLQRDVAIKVIDVPFRDESDYMQRFEREARAIASLTHPHIVALYRYGEAEGLLYMAMSYIPGSDLGQLLQTYEAEGAWMDPGVIAALASQIGAALDYAHERGVIHRDVKPSNIVLAPEGQAVLTDFGLVLLEAVGTRGEVLGTPNYLAPEQAISSAGALPQSDLYALGVILYRAFTGRLPFTGADPLEVALMQVTEVPPAPRTYRPDLSPAVEAVILKAMAKDPAARYQTGAALAGALAEALGLAGTAVPAVPPTLKLAQGVTPANTTLPPRARGIEERLDTQTATGVPAGSPATTRRRRLWPLLVFPALLLLCLALAGLVWSLNTDGKVDAGAVQVTPPPVTIIAAGTGIETPTPHAAQATITTTAISVAHPTRRSPAPYYLPLLLKSAEAGNGEAVQLPVNTATTPAPAAASPTPVPLPSPQATVTRGSYPLLFIRSGNSLFVANVGDRPVPLEQLTLSMDGRRRFDEWPVPALPAAGCVRIQRDEKAGRALPSPCAVAAGDPVTFRWKDDFRVIHDGEQLLRCRLKKDLERCTAMVPVW